MPSGRASMLPAELLSLIFAPLDQPDVLAAAAVCAWWRVNAVQAPSYYRAWTFIFPRRAKLSIWRRDNYDDLGAFQRVVADSEAGDYALGLRVFIELEFLPGSPAIADVGLSELLELFSNGGRPEEDLEALMSELCGIVMPVLRRAAARCVVLDLAADTESAQVLLDGLSSPAPFLRILTIDMSAVRSQAAPRALPADFLAASTVPPRRLTEVTLRSTDLISPSPAFFPTVRNLSLLRPNDRLHPDYVAAVFPNLRCLTVEARPFYLHKLQSSEGRIFLGRLQELHVGPGDTSIAEIYDLIIDDAKRVPCIQCRSMFVERFAPLLSVEPSEGNPGRISLHISEHTRPDGTEAFDRAGDIFVSSSDADHSRFSQLSVELRYARFTRVVDADVPFARVFGVLRTAGCARYVTELTIDDRHLVTFMKTCGGCMLALTFLRVDLLTWAATLGDESEEMLGLPRQWWQTADGEEPGILSDGGPPRGDFPIEWPSLERIELRATRPHSTLSHFVLSSLARTFNGPGLQLALSNGLSLTPDARGADVAALFLGVRVVDVQFYPNLDVVARAEKLRRHAAADRRPALPWSELQFDDALIEQCAAVFSTP